MHIETILGNTRFITGHECIPLYMTDEHHCILLDSGTYTMREELEKVLEDAGITPIGIMSTHTHFDHFGNASYFSKKYNCPVALPLGEAETCRTIDSVKAYLFTYPIGQVRQDPLLANLPCLVDHIIRPEETTTLFRGVLFRVLHTPGHSIDHVSYITPDRVCYTGDALLSGKSLSHSKLLYAFDIRRSMESMSLFKDLDCPVLVTAHGGVEYPPFDELVQQNREALEHSLAFVKGIVDHPMSTSEIAKEVCRRMNISVDTPKKAQNLERFLRPYSECMLDDGSHHLEVKDGDLLYVPS